MKVREDRERGRDQQRGSRQRLGARGRWVSALSLGRSTCAHGLGVACALWVSTGWAQEPANPEQAPEAAPPAPEAPDAPAAGDPGGTESPAADAAVDPSLEPQPEDIEAQPEEIDMLAADDGGPAEVVVTVDRRQKNLQDYSGTAAAFSEKQLTNIGVTNVTNLSQVVPGLQISVNDQGSSSIYIRGVGSDNTTELGDPAVALHLDNVYIPRVRGMNAAYLDVERIEVNSGPQGTLRGRNASGGSINIISRRPVFSEYQASAEVTFGTYQQRAYQGMLNIPFGDNLALRVAGASTNIDETWVNEGPLQHLPGAQDVNDYALKGALRWQPVSRLDLTVAADYTNQRSAGYFGANMNNLFTNTTDRGTPDNLSDDLSVPLDPNVDDPRVVYRRGEYPRSQLEHWGVRINGTYDAGPVIFEALASYRYQGWDLHNGAGAGFFVPDQAPEGELWTASTANLGNQQWDNWSFNQTQDNTSKSMVGEFRIASPDDQRLVWSVGVFGFHEDQGAFLGQVTGDPGGYNEFNMPSTISKSIAVYGDATFKVTPEFRLLGGLRWTKEWKSRLGGLWMIGNGLPTGGTALCAAQNSAGECTTFGLANDGIGRFGTEGFEWEGLDRENYNVPAPTTGPNGANPRTPETQTERVNFFLDGVKSFGARDQIGIALCNDPPAVSQIQQNPNNPPTVVADESRLERNADGNYRCRYGIRDNILNATNNYNDARPQNGRNEDAYIDFRVGTEFDLSKENMLYGTLSSGHKAGGFNDSFPNPDDPENFLTPGYGPETAYSLEIGSKNEFLGRKLRVNASAFAYLYRNLQFQTIITVGEPPPLQPNGQVAINPETGVAFPDNRGGAAVRQNAEDTARILGLDLDVVLALPAGLEVGVHPLIMDARFPDNTYVNDDRLGLGVAPAQVDIGSNWLPRVSPFTLNYHISQLIFTDVGTFDWIIQGQTRGPHFFTAFNGDGSGFETRGPGWGVNPITGMPAPIEATDPDGAGPLTPNAQYEIIANQPGRLNDRVPTYTTVNLGLGWRKPDGMISVRGFVNNVFNTTYATSIATQPGNYTRFYNDPRMAGVRVRMDF